MAVWFQVAGRSDDDAVSRLVGACRSAAPDATEEEIAHFLKGEAARFLHNPRIHNLSGLLLAQVPKCFEGESFRLYRDAEQKRKEALEREQRESERRYRELEEEQRRIFADPQSSQADRLFAGRFLGLGRNTES